MVKKPFERFQKLRKTQFTIAEAAKSRSSLSIEKCEFYELVLNKIFHLIVFICINRSLTAKYTPEKLSAK